MIQIQNNIPLADKNWFRTGGPARFYCEPTTAQEYAQALQFAKEHDVEIFVLGQGANILVSDAGFDGLVIRPQLLDITLRDISSTSVFVQAGAGVPFEKLIIFCLENNLIGLEEFSGIPGTVGGSVFINIHYFEFLLDQFLVSAQIIHKITGEVLTVDRTWFNFGYNTSALHDQPYYLVTATFKLNKVSPIESAYARGRSSEIIRHRTKRYPNSGTCGSFFRNFLEHEAVHARGGKNLIFVAYYLDQIGVKGQLTCGDAVVSYQHANMLVNKGAATTQDIITLARTMQELVQQHFDIIPVPECRLVGFKEYPLLK